MADHARAKQLRRLAQNKGISVVELIEYFINRSIDEGELKDGLPDFPILARGKIVSCQLGRLVLRLSPPAAQSFANLIMQYVNLEKDHNSKPSRDRDGNTMMVRRAGRGLMIIDKRADGTIIQTSMTLQMGRDIARQLCKQADLAESTS